MAAPPVPPIIGLSSYTQWWRLGVQGGVGSFPFRYVGVSLEGLMRVVRYGNPKSATNGNSLNFWESFFFKPYVSDTSRRGDHPLRTTNVTFESLRRPSIWASRDYSQRVTFNDWFFGKSSTFGRPVERATRLLNEDGNGVCGWGAFPVRSGMVTRECLSDNLRYAGAEMTTVVSSSLTNGLVAYYQLSDELDRSGNDRTLTNNAGVTFIDGYRGRAAHFDAASSQYLSSSNSSFSISGNISVSCWFKFASASDYKRLISRFLQGTGGYTLATTPNNELGFGCVGTGGTANPTTHALNNDQWYHVVGTFQASTSTATLYLDNALVLSEAIPGGGSMATPSVDFMIGAFDNPPTNFMDGDINKVGIWNRVLTASEIASLYRDDTVWLRAMRTASSKLQTRMLDWFFGRTTGSEDMHVLYTRGRYA